MLYGVFQKNVLKKIDEYSARGVELSTSKTGDYLLRIDSNINDYLEELAMGPGKIPAKFNIVHNPVDNESGYDTSEIKLWEPGDDDFTVELEGARSYFCEVTGPCDMYVEEYDGSTWVILSSASLTSTASSFTEKSGEVTAASSTSDIRMRLTGSYPFSYRNYKLYDCQFSTSGTVQQHRPVFKYDLPSDFLFMDSIEFTDRYGKTRPYSGYVIYDADGKIGLDRYDVGSYEVNYFRAPTLISTSALSTEVVDCVPHVIPSLTMACAAEVMATENVQLSAFFMNMYEGRKMSVKRNPETRQNTIENTMGW
jgi:hypothetical protein